MARKYLDTLPAPVTEAKEYKPSSVENCEKAFNHLLPLLESGDLHLIGRALKFFRLFTKLDFAEAFPRRAELLVHLMRNKQLIGNVVNNTNNVVPISAAWETDDHAAVRRTIPDDDAPAYGDVEVG